MALTDKLKAIADAIRGKTGKSASITLDEMISEINNLPVLSSMNGIIVDEYWSADDEDIPSSKAVGMPKTVHLVGDVYKDKIPDGMFRSFSGSSPTTYVIFYFSKTIILPSTILIIGAGAFVGLNYLTNFVIPDTVTVIGQYAFNSFGSSENIFNNILPASLTTIDDYAFAYSHLSPDLVIPEGVVTIGSYAFAANTSTGSTNPNKYLYNVTFPISSLKTIKDHAFYSRMNLKAVNIPDSVTYLGSYAFGRCTSMRTIKIGKGITSIPDGCFTDIGTYGTGDITIEIPDTITSFGSRAFENAYITSFTVPLQVTSMGYFCFYGCPKLISFECRQAIPMTVSGSGVVVSCTNLINVILGGYNNPYNTTLLTSVSFKSCSNSDLVITVYTEGALPLSTAPFGATSATIIYKNSTVEEEAA